MLIALCCSASAEDVYVKNKPFKGTTYGSGMDTELGLEALAEQLGMKFRENNGLWDLGEYTIPGRTLDGVVIVPLSALRDAGFRVMLSPDLDTIDIGGPDR
jgi:hypothetical protein